MLKRIVISLLALGFIVTATGAAFSAEPTGNDRKGKYLFRKSCRECHKEGATATPLNPDSKTQAQWEKAFAKDAFQEFQCKDEWAKMSAEDLNDVFTYMYNHAFDSPSPAKCK